MAADTPSPLPDFSAIDVPSETVRTNGAGDIVIRPITVGQMPRFARAIKASGPAIFALFGRTGSIDPSEVLDLLADHGDGIIDAIAVCVARPRDEIASLSVGELVPLLTAIVRLNIDYFGPVLRSLAAQDAMAAGEPSTSTDGPTPSSVLSEAGTA